MRLYQRIITAGAIIGLSILGGCRTKTLEGTVKEEFGTAQGIIDSSGALFGDRSVKFGDPNYGLVLETEEGEYTISVKEILRKPIYALAKAIEPGDQVRITFDHNTRIDEDGIGITDSDTIKLIQKGQ